MAKGAYTNEKRIAVPFAMLAEKWPQIAKQMREGRLEVLQKLAEHGLVIGIETWNMLCKADAATVRLEYDDKWTSFVGVVSERGMEAELGLVVGAVDVGFSWGQSAVTEERLSSVTRIHMEALLGTALPELTEAVMAELTEGSDVELADVAVKIAQALAGVGPEVPGPTA